jgi:pimeloyl-ACP methyl ester carboxylesterase
MAKVFRSEQGRRAVYDRYQEILDAWPVENRQYYVATIIGPTFIIESGRHDNPPLILLHGSVSNSFTWFTDVVELSKSYRVLAVDIIGDAGLSAMERPGYSSGSYEKWLEELLAELNIKSAHFAGISLGGWMAINFALHFPKAVLSLFLISPGGLASVSRFFLWKVLFYSLTGNKDKIFEMLNGGKPIAESQELSTAMAFTELINKHFKPRTAELPVFRQEELEKLTMPLMLIFGAKDCIFSAGKAVRLLATAVPHTEVLVYPEAGHIIVNQSEKLLKFLEEHFKRPAHGLQ